MSPITEAHVLYREEAPYPFIGAIILAARQTSKRKDIFKEVIEIHLIEAWDEKINLEALYASGEIERFKQDVLPLVTKRLNQ